MLEKYNLKLKNTLYEIDEDLGGDVIFLPPIFSAQLEKFEEKILWKLPSVFRYFYTKESNGIIIDDKRIYSFYDPDTKKTWVENLERMNTPETSSWFKEKPHIFNDYVVIGNDNSIVFCLSKKYSFDNPAIYICKNSNEKKVDLNNLNLDLESLILEMTRQAF